MLEGAVMMHIIKVCGYRCGRRYDPAQFEALKRIAVGGVPGEFVACKCGSIVFDTVEDAPETAVSRDQEMLEAGPMIQWEDPPPCSTCGTATIRVGGVYKCVNCGNTTSGTFYGNL